MPTVKSAKYRARARSLDLQLWLQPIPQSGHTTRSRALITAPRRPAFVHKSHTAQYNKQAARVHSCYGRFGRPAMRDCVHTLSFADACACAWSAPPGVPINLFGVRNFVFTCRTQVHDVLAALCLFGFYCKRAECVHMPRKTPRAHREFILATACKQQ